MVKFETVAQYSAFNNNPVLHPLVNFVDLSKAAPRKRVKMHVGLYMVILKEIKCGGMRYGRNYYDYEEGTFVFIAPGQVIGSEDDQLYHPRGFALVFHPDFIKGTSLARHIHNYTFFSYEVNEALHVSDSEKAILTDCFNKIHNELQHAIDKHTKQLIVSNLELLLNYCVRYYERQFVTREGANKGVIERFETLLHDYFQSDKPQLIGLPSVAYFAGQISLSANYFGDLVKKETGKSAHDYIQEKIIDVAKSKIFDPHKSVSEVAYELGFKYPQHFSRLFKQMVGHSPNEYRSLN